MPAPATRETVEFDGAPVFEQSHRGFVVRAHYLKPPHEADALIELVRDGEVLRSFRYPAYRVWNVAAHACDYIDALEGQLEDEARRAGKEG